MQIAGQCHCGNIRYQLDWPSRTPSISVRTCQCSFCQKHGAVYASEKNAKLKVIIQRFDSVNRYRFGTQTADFYICQTCGVVPFIVSSIQEHDYAVVNVHTFEPSHGVELHASAADFEGETPEHRLARREKNWISNVEINSGSEFDDFDK